MLATAGALPPRDPSLEHYHRRVAEILAAVPGGHPGRRAQVRPVGRHAAAAGACGGWRSALRRPHQVATDACPGRRPARGRADQAGQLLETVTQSHLDAWASEAPRLRAGTPGRRELGRRPRVHGRRPRSPLAQLPRGPARHGRRGTPRPSQPPAASRGRRAAGPARSDPHPALRPAGHAGGPAQGHRGQPRRLRRGAHRPRRHAGTAQGARRPPRRHRRRRRTPGRQPLAVPRRERADVRRPPQGPARQSQP
jgi:hypothetical protein